MVFFGNYLKHEQKHSLIVEFKFNTVVWHVNSITQTYEAHEIELVFPLVFSVVEDANYISTRKIS